MRTNFLVHDKKYVSGPTFLEVVFHHFKMWFAQESDSKEYALDSQRNVFKMQ